jgi:hypothetical protein
LKVQVDSYCDSGANSKGERWQNQVLSVTQSRNEPNNDLVLFFTHRGKLVKKETAGRIAGLSRGENNT